MGLQVAGRADRADAVEQGNGEVAQVGFWAVVAELLAHNPPEVTAQLMAGVEGLDRIVDLGVGRIQLAERVLQHLVDVGLLLGQHCEHLQPHGSFVVIGTQQLLELGDPLG